MYWHEEDLIMVSDGVSGRCRYKLASGAGTTEATFVLDESSMRYLRLLVGVIPQLKS